MARTTKQLSGGGKDKLLRALVATEAHISADAAARLGDTLCSAIADVRVRREAWEPVRNTTAPANGNSTSPPPLVPVDVAAPAPAAAPFDPFAFSALAVLTKKGFAELSARLATISSATDLHTLATAQHLTVEASLTELAALRAAIVKATEQRLAERRAAAS